MARTPLPGRLRDTPACAPHCASPCVRLRTPELLPSGSADRAALSAGAQRRFKPLLPVLLEGRPAAGSRGCAVLRFQGHYHAASWWLHRDLPPWGVLSASTSTDVLCHWGSTALSLNEQERGASSQGRTGSLQVPCPLLPLFFFLVVAEL